MSEYAEKVQINKRKIWTKKQILDTIGEERYKKICEMVKEKGNKISYKDFTPYEIEILIDLTPFKPMERDFAFLVFVNLWTLEETSFYIEEKYGILRSPSYASVYKHRISNKLKNTCFNICV